MGKFALRGLAQSLARELGPKGIHVAHFVIDGGIIKAGGDARAASRGADGMLDPDAIAEAYSTRTGSTARRGASSSTCGRGSSASSRNQSTWIPVSRMSLPSVATRPARNAGTHRRARDDLEAAAGRFLAISGISRLRFISRCTFIRISLAYRAGASRPTHETVLEAGIVSEASARWAAPPCAACPPPRWPSPCAPDVGRISGWS